LEGERRERDIAPSASASLSWLPRPSAASLRIRTTEGPMPVYTYTTLDDPSANNFTQAYGINASGQIVGEYIDASNHTHGFLYSNGTYTTLDGPLATGTIALGINDLGQVVGSYNDASGTHGFLYNNGTYTTLNDPLATTNTTAFGINDAGQIAGFYINASGNHGFLYDPNSGISPPYFNLAEVGTQGTLARGINAAEQIVGSYQNGSGVHGFLIGGLEYITLDDPLATGGTVALGINDLGQIVGHFNNGAHGFLYSNGTYTTLDDPLAAHGMVAAGINASGQIVGQYVDANNHIHGFLLTITPNPPPPTGTTADMILRHGADGQYEIYDIGNNSLLAA
jgi:probable HAF family extracellular repeat protein